MNPDALFSATQPIPFHALSATAEIRLGAANHAQGRQRAPCYEAPVVWPDGAGSDVVFLYARNQPVGAVQSDPPAQSLDADFDRADGLLCPFWQH